jgi:hypothetical protein
LKITNKRERERERIFDPMTLLFSREELPEGASPKYVEENKTNSHENKGSKTICLLHVNEKKMKGDVIEGERCFLVFSFLFCHP